MSIFTYEKATSWKQAATRLKESNGEVRAQGGGIDNLDLYKEGLISPKSILSLLSLRTGKNVSVKSNKSIKISSLATLSEISVDPLILNAASALAEAAGLAATPNIRNGATLGGNLCQQNRCSYFRSHLFECLRKGGNRCPALEGDNESHAIFENTFCAAVLPSSLAISLTALEASAIVQHGDGTTDKIPVEKLYKSAMEDPKEHLSLLPGDLLESIEIDPSPNRVISHYLKVKPRDSFDWPLVECAIALHLHEGTIKKARIVMGGVAMIPWRATLVEEALREKKPTASLAKEAAMKAAHGATPLAHNEYKTHLMAGAVERMLLELIHREGGQHAPR